jgi:hypothetical protein
MIRASYPAVSLLVGVLKVADIAVSRLNTGVQALKDAASTFMSPRRSGKRLGSYRQIEIVPSRADGVPDYTRANIHAHTLLWQIQPKLATPSDAEKAWNNCLVGSGLSPRTDNQPFEWGPPRKGIEVAIRYQTKGEDFSVFDDPAFFSAYREVISGRVRHYDRPDKQFDKKAIESGAKKLKRAYLEQREQWQHQTHSFYKRAA